MGHLTRLNAELADGLVEEKAGAPNVTGRAHTHREDMLTGRLESKRLVERSYTVDVDKWHAESLRDSLDRLFG